MRWTRSDIVKLNEYQYLENRICQYPQDLLLDNVEELAQLFSLEAELLTQNKPVKCYLQGKLFGIRSFKAALGLKELYLKRNQLVTYLPINLKNYEEQRRISY